MFLLKGQPKVASLFRLFFVHVTVFYSLLFVLHLRPKLQAFLFIISLYGTGTGTGTGTVPESANTHRILHDYPGKHVLLFV